MSEPTALWFKLYLVSFSGEAYTVKVSFVVQPTGSDIEVESEGLIGTFVSKPLPPTNLKLGPGWNQISWTKSPTPNVR